MRLVTLSLFLAALGASAPASAGDLAKLAPASHATDLLGGRLRVRLPAAARIEARRASIMAAPASVEDETRVVLDAQKERMVLMTYELFATVGADLEGAVRSMVGSWAEKPQVEALKLQGLRAVAVVPATLDKGREAIWVLGVYVARTDSTAQYLAFYLNPAAAGDADGGTDLARRIASTLTEGSRALPMEAGPRTLSDGLSLTAPAGWVLTRMDGPDFTVYRLRQPVPLGTPGPVVGIYLGHHPSYQHDQTDEPPGEVKKESGKMLGAAVEWHVWTRGKPPAADTLMEAMVAVPGGQHGLVAHLFLTAPAAAQLPALRAIAESLAAK